MAEEGMEIKGNLKKGLLISIRSTYKCACNHPFVLCVLVLLFLLYRACPSLFAFLVSSSPVIICTALLLGVLLNYGEPNIPDIEVEYKRVHEISSMREASVVDNILVKQEGILAADAHLEDFSREEKSNAQGHAYRQVPFGEEEEVEDEEEEKVQTLLEIRPLIKFAREDVHVRERATDDNLSSERSVDEAEDLTASQEDISQTENDVTKMNEPASVGIPWQHVGKDDDSSESESDRAESSSPDASMADIIPMLDELHPLLPSDTHQPTHEHESDDGSVEEAEHHEEEDDEEGHEGKDDGAEAAVSWTAVDQKNLMDLGTSELERNRRLENLIAKRRAKKDLRFDTERNLIDFDSNDTTPILEHLSHLLVQIPRFSAQRHNPFDLPCDSEQTEDLPPIPGSAPSVLLPGGNPFDFTYDERVESDSPAAEGWNRQDHVTAPQHDLVFRRHESFAIGESSSGHIRERFNSRLKPYFVPERMDSEETGFPRYERQSSEISEAKASSIHESDSVSSVNDQEHKDLIEEELHQDDEHPSQSHLVFEPQLENRSSFEVDSVAAEQQMNMGILAGVLGVGSRTADVIEEIHQVPDSFGEVLEGIEFTESMSGSCNLEVIEEQYDDLSSSSSSDDSERGLQTVSSEGPNDMEQNKAHLANEASFHEQPHPPITDDRDDDSQLSDPIYDSSPSALEKSLSISTSVDEALFDAGKEDLYLPVEMQTEIPGTASSPLVDKSIVLESENFVSIGGRARESLPGGGGSWMGVSNLCAVDENELKSGGVSEIDEDDVIGRGFFGHQENANDPLQAVTPISSSQSVSSSYAVISDDLASSHSIHYSESNMHPLSSAEESYISVLDLPTIPEEKLDFKLEELGSDVIRPHYKSTEKTSGNNEENEIHIISEENAEVVCESDGKLADLNAHISKDDDETGGESEQGCSEIEENKEIYENFLSELDAIGDFSVEKHVSDQRESNRDLHTDGKSHEVQKFSVITSARPNLPSYPQADIGSSKNIDVYDPHFGCPVVAGVSLPPNEDPELTIYNSSLHVLDACSVEVIDVAYKQHGQDASSSTSSVLEIPTKTEDKSPRTLGTDLPISEEAENISQKPEILEDIQVKVGNLSEFPCEDNPEKSSSSKKQSEERFQDDSDVGACKENLVQVEVNSSNLDTDSDILELEAKSIEDSNSVFKKVRKASITSSMISEVGSSDSLPDSMDMDLLETPSDMQVVEARSLEDIDMALNQLSKDAKNDPVETELREEAERSERQVKLPVMDDGSEISMSNTELPVSKSKSMGVIDSAFQGTGEGTSIESFHSEVGPSYCPQNLRPVETQKPGIDLEAVEAESLDDTHTDSSQISDDSCSNVLVHPRLENETSEPHAEVKQRDVPIGPDRLEPDSMEKQSSCDP